MITRKIGKIVRGKATPFQIILASALGAALGFVPGVGLAPGLFITLALLLIVLNANLAVAAIVGVVAKIVALLAAPVSFATGRALLDGPTRPIFEWMINAPVLALFGFERYLVTGGLALGLIFGLLAGALIVWGVGRFRKRMASLEENSERYKRLASKWWSRLLVFVFIGGGHGKKTYSQLMTRRLGNPIRPIGAVLAVGVVALLILVQQFFSGPIVTAALTRGLERANGATVDVREAEMDLRAGRLVIEGLAMADPNDLDTDLLRAQSVEADISGADLLRKRLSMDRVVVRDASHGEARQFPGRLIGPPPVTPEPPPSEEGEKTIEDYVAQAKEWKRRLSQIREWLERLGGDEAREDLPPKQRKETLAERLRRRVQEKGYARVVASHLIEGSPRFLVRELRIEGMTTPRLPDETIDVLGENLSTNPGLVEAPARLRVRSSGRTLESDVTLAGAGETRGGEVVFAYRGLPADRVASGLNPGGEPPFRGGTIDVGLDGSIDLTRTPSVDMPMRVTLRDSQLRLPEIGDTQVESLTIPIGLRGPFDNPRITLSRDALAEALKQAGKDQIAERLGGKAGQLKEKAREEIGEKVGGEAGEAAGRFLEGLGGKKKKSEGDDNDDQTPDGGR